MIWGGPATGVSICRSREGGNLFGLTRCDADGHMDRGVRRDDRSGIAHPARNKVALRTLHYIRSTRSRKHINYRRLQGVRAFSSAPAFVDGSLHKGKVPCARLLQACRRWLLSGCAGCVRSCAICWRSLYWVRL